VRQSQQPTINYDVVGPVCETGDFLGKARDLSIQEDSVLAVHAAGAYGSVMSSNYNTRQRAAEVLVDGDQAHLIRMRETFDQMLANEIIPDG
ncbi:MAG: diaminopimelate decarboxylase, partial [Pseudomonadota bacterium]